MAETITIKELIKQSSLRYKDNIAFQIKRDSKYVSWTFDQATKMAQNLSIHLSAQGIAHGDKVAILSENRPEWAIAYLGIASMGAVAVPLDALLPVSDHINLIKDSGAKGIIVSQKFLEDLKSKRTELPEIQFIVSMDYKEEKEGVLSFIELTEKAQGVVPDNGVKLDDLASIVYTSGTTGVAKGVMLSHKNIMSNVLALSGIFPMIGSEDNFLSVLPMHHTFETTTGFLCPFFMGAKITYAESLKSHSLLANMQETGVTIMLGVPLLYRLFFDGILRGVEEKGLFAKLLFKLLFSVSKIFKTVFRINIGRVLFSMVHSKLGDNVRFWVSGAAAIDPEVINGFDLMGITILQGYGLSESSPVLACCSLKNNVAGSVGNPLPEVIIKIIDVEENGSGQIIAKGPNIMQGYYKKPEITAETIKDGWLYTGDIGRFDKQGYLFITGRQKDVIVSGSGLNVFPEEIEIELNKISLISESCVLGRKIKTGMRKGMEEIVALVIPDPQRLQSSDFDAVSKEIKQEVRKLSQKLPEHKRISDVVVRKEEFPKTSTKKIKRFVLRKEMGFI